MASGAIRKHPMQILMVEDNPADVLLMKIAFGQRAADVNLQVAVDGLQAIEFLGESETSRIRPDLILLDLNLPKLSGHEVLKIIKSTALTACIPVIIFSSSRLKEDVQTAYSSFANAYLQKPGDLDHLLAVVDQINSFWFACAALPA